MYIKSNYSVCVAVCISFSHLALVRPYSQRYPLGLAVETAGNELHMK